MTYKDRNCLECGLKYSPSNSTQKYCFSCGKKKRREFGKEYYQKNKKKLFQQSKEYHKKYYQENKDKIKERVTKYRQEHKKEINESNKQYSQEHKEEIGEYNKKYYQKNKDYFREYHKKYRQDNEDKIKEMKKKDYQEHEEEVKERSKKYRQEHEEEVREWQKDYRQRPEVKVRNNFNSKNRKLYDKHFNIAGRLRNLLLLALKKYTKTGKYQSSKKYGINWGKVIKHLEPFPDDLFKYHIDHIRPLCSFNFINEDGSQNLEEIRKAFAPENHQWLTIQENLSKGGRY